MATPATNPNTAATAPVIGKGQATTNTAPNSKVAVPVEPLIAIRFRFFPANATAALENQTMRDAKSLSGLPFCVGTLEGEKFTPLHDALQRLNAGTESTGKLEKGLFRTWTADEETAWHKAFTDAKKPDQKVPKLRQHETGIYRIKPGVTLAICIGVDAKAKYRKYPLWKVTAVENDIVVNVYETYGKEYALISTATKAGTRNTGTEDKPHNEDQYTARLTGDLWMQSTPKLGVTEVEAIPQDRATPAMKTALKRIYAADFTMVGSDFAIDIPRQQDEKDTASVRLVWIAAQNANCIDNIKTLNLRQDVPSRIHPEAYAAAAKAAHDAGIDTIQFSSSWRPMLGSMPHRLGMGLDLIYLKSGKDSVHLNRKGLLAQGTSHGSTENLSQDELKAYDDWQAKQKGFEAAKVNQKAAENKLAAVKAAQQAIKNPAPETAAAQQKAVDDAAQNLKSAETAMKTAEKESIETKNTWTDQLANDQPGSVGKYRRYVMQAQCVSQVLDPWYLTGLPGHKAGELVPNEQVGEGGLALQHNNHMHLSIKDPELTA